MIDRYDFHRGRVFTVDFDRDGDTDILGPEFRTGMVWHENDGGGQFQPRVSSPAGRSTRVRLRTSTVTAISTRYPGRQTLRLRGTKIGLSAMPTVTATVAFADFLLLSANYGKQVDAIWSDGDFNEDGKVDFADFLILSANFGTK